MRPATRGRHGRPGSHVVRSDGGLWGAFVTLVAASPETLERAYDWLTGLALVWEILMWIVLLPWAVSLGRVGELVGALGPGARRGADRSRPSERLGAAGSR